MMTIRMVLTSRAYQIDGFDAGSHTINEELNIVPIVVFGSSTWDIFGTAISGQRETESLNKTDSYIAY